MPTPLNGQTIVNKFHLFCGDQSELSTQDELDLLNKQYDDVLNSRVWNFLKKPTSGSISTDGVTAWITLPTDFRFFVENNEKTDNASTTYNNASQKVIFVGPDYTPYQLVNWSDRRQFKNTSGYAYVDLANNKIVFTSLPCDYTYEFDYIGNWDAIELNTYPIFPGDFHDMLYHAMCVDSNIINLVEKANSYAAENKKSVDDMMQKLCYYDSMFSLN